MDWIAIALSAFNNADKLTKFAGVFTILTTLTLPDAIAYLIILLLFLACIRIIYTSVAQVYHIIISMLLCSFVSLLVSGWCMSDQEACLLFYQKTMASYLYCLDIAVTASRHSIKTSIDTVD